jgi:hypothetical protein
MAGQGTFEQIRADLDALGKLDAQYVLFDTYDNHPESTAHPERDWAALSLLVESVLDLSGAKRTKENPQIILRV